MPAPAHVPPACLGALRPLFQSHVLMPVTIAAVLEGRMGRAMANDPAAPTAAFVHLGAFVVFGGDPGAPAVDALLQAAPAVQLVGEQPEWHARLGARLPPDYTRHTRWHFSPDTLDPGHLRTLRVPAAAGLEIVPVTAALLPAYRASGLAEQFEENFGDLGRFLREGFGVLARRGDCVVGHAGTYATCSFGMEVQIEVLPDERGRGTATALAAELLLCSLERGLEPHWDAENPISSRLARRLGYRLERAYTVYFPGAL